MRLPLLFLAGATLMADPTGAVPTKVVPDTGANAALTVSSSAGPADPMSSVEISALCGRHDLSGVTDGPRECAAHCAKLHYTREYDYTSYDACYRCCFSGAACIPPQEGASACTGHGRCNVDKAKSGRGAKGTCTCDEDWTGAFCERRTNSCPRWGKQRLACAGNGECKNAACACKPGYTGKACEKKMCPVGRGGKPCSGQPCNFDTGTCRCGSLWKNKDCSVAACPVAANGKECNGHGKCGDDHRCDCTHTGYFGDACHKKACPKDSAGQTCGGRAKGTCDTNGSGKCHCRPGITGPACAGVECPLVNGKPCGGPGRGVCDESLGRCKCERLKWAGPNCERPACPRPSAGDAECGGNGECVTAVDRITRKKRSTCKCDDNHDGEACERKKCPADRHGNECSARAGQGTCNGKTGVCKCSGLFEGPACTLKKCYRDPEGKVCSGNGRCNGATGECECDAKHKGHRCHVRACKGFTHANPKGECSGRGECNNAGCICAAGWKGEACELRSCPSDSGIECNLQGECDGKTGKCKCTNRWRGASCEEKVCIFSKINGKECGGNGKCVDGKCQCAKGWRDHACDNKICPFANGKECNGVGVCEEGKCRCHIEWRGANCGTYYQARFGSADSLPNYNNVYKQRKAYNSAKQSADFAARVDVVKGDLFEALLTCNLANIHPTGHGHQFGNVYMRLQAKGPVTQVETPTLGVAANIGHWQPITSVALMRATADGEVRIGAEYWAGDRTTSATYVYCDVGAFRVLSGRATLVTNKDSLDIKTNTFKPGKSYNTGARLSASVAVKKGETVRSLLTCALWNTGGGTSYMRAVASGSAQPQDSLPGNWITSTVKAGGGWSQGASIGVFTARSDGVLNVQGSYHAGSSTGSYGPCSIMATVVNGTWTGATSTPGYSRTWTTRQTVKANAGKVTDFSTTVQVNRGDYVRVLISTNMIGRSGHTHYMRVIRTGGTAPTNVVTQGNWATSTSAGQWHPGVSQAVYKALGDGTITFAGTYHSGGDAATTYVYSNIYAEVLGPRHGADNAALKACPKHSGRACNGPDSGSCDSVLGKCKCIAPFTGRACEVRQCERSEVNGRTCGGQGKCQADGSCACNAGWRGEACDDKVCPKSPVNGKECRGVGECFHGLCRCGDGWSGESCDAKDCPVSASNGKQCGVNGACDGKTGGCKCHKGWTGRTCDTRA